MDVGIAAVGPRKKDCCVILCIVKAILFALVAVFILYLPLGDPSNYCAKANERQNRQEAMCCLCHIYLISVRVARTASELVEVMIRFVWDLLYETKLKFYSILERIDRDDLCRSICCSDSTDSYDVKKEHKHPACRCSKKCVRKNLDKS